MNDHLTGTDLPSQAARLTRDQRTVVLVLVDAGFSWADAKAWARGWECHQEPPVVLQQATAFAAYGGFTIAEAIGWHKHMVWMPEAASWMQAGYTPAQASRVRSLVDTLQDAMNWIATGLPAHRVITYLQAGVTTGEAPTFEHSPDVTPQTLTFMAAFLGR